MTNAEMIPRRFERWAAARKLLAMIRRAHDAGQRVQVSTYTKSKLYGPRCASMFSADRQGVYVQRGKSSDDITQCHVRAVW